MLNKYKSRKQKLKNLLAVILQNQDALCKATSKDFGYRSFDETYLLEIVPTVRAIRHTLSHLKKWMMPKKLRVSPLFWMAKAKIIPEPKGHVAIISPWNYPIQLSLIPLVSAIAAGNYVSLKLSEYAPKTAALLKKIIEEVFGKEVDVVLGGANIAKEFVAKPYDHIFFTGSTAVGKKVMKAASEHLTPVTLELGGKSPVIVTDDYSVEKAVASILTGKLFNSGQTCVAPDYVFLPDSKVNDFVGAAKIFLKKYFTEQKTGIITKAQQSRLVNMLMEVKDKVALQQNGLTLVLNPPVSASIMQEEIFGPILPIVTYNNLSDVLAHINHRSKPLALYLFTNDKKIEQLVLENTQAGGVTINETLLHAAMDNLPFGGVGASGMGCYHGSAGFDCFTHYKPIVKAGRFNGFKLLRPPIAKWKMTLLKKLY